MNNLNSTSPFTTPVLFMVFNRPDTTKRVFDAIRQVKPTKLYIVADGPRADRPTDREKCEAVRKLVSQVDWSCEVKKDFRDENFGCGKGPASAITWLFQHEEEGIILEDDCLPSQPFFYFCAEMLERYRHDTRIMEIGGNNFEPFSQRRNAFSYYFSEMTYIWGWATWRRAWKMFDYEMKLYPEIARKALLKNQYDFVYQQEHYEYIFSKMYIGDNVTSRKTVWDYQWQFAIKINSGLVIVPERNLVTNLGFGKEATNTKDPIGAGNNFPMETIEFPLRHPETMMVDKSRDHWYFNYICTSRAFRIRSNIKRFIPKRIFDKALPFYKKYLRVADTRFHELPESSMTKAK